LAYLERDGVRLHYEDNGAGDPPLLLVHGWTCNLRHWSAQARHFSRNHRVVAADLRGHGQSDSPRQDYTMEGYADDLAWLCDGLGVERPVVCGHSMGGVVTLVTMGRHPELVPAGVLVDSPFPPIPAGNQQRLAPAIEALAKPDYLSFATKYIEGMFSPLDDPDRKAAIMTGMLTTPQHVMLSSLQSNANTDTAAIAKQLKQPLLVISAGHMTFSDPSRLRSEFPGVHYAQTFGSGHFNMVEVPAQVNAIIESFLTTLQ
jgi:pimeloyl-ACP methyl ester carboxylesterase